MSDLVLVSTSPYRRALMERLGVSFRCREPKVDEEALKDDGLGPLELAERLAMAKALSLCDEEPHATLIGCDQLVSFEGRTLGKPGTAEGAVEQLTALAGRKHRLITVLAVWHEGRIYPYTDITTLHMRPLAHDAIVRYVAADRPLDCAGSYKLEERGITLFERIVTDDYTAILGLPLIALTTILRAVGFDIP